MTVSWDKARKRWLSRITTELGGDDKKWLPAGSTKEQAKEFDDDRRVKVRRIKAGLEVRDRNPERLTVADITKAWMKKRGARTQDAVRLHVIETPLGALPIDKVTTAVIDDHLEHLAPAESARVDVLSPATRNHIRTHLVGIFKRALKRKLLVGENPATNAERAKTEKQTLTTLTAEEAARLVAASEYPWNAINAAGLSGLRRGEIWGINVADVDLDRLELRVRRSHSRVTKSGKERVVPIHPAFKPVFARAVDVAVSSVLFPGRKGRRRSEETKGVREFRACLVAAGIVDDAGAARKVRFHDLRHTCATLMLQAGAPIQHVSKVLGHASIQITMDTYGHLVTDDLHAAVKLVDMKLPPLRAVGGAE